ncbi:MAG: lipocalin family protein [Sphingobacteriales bacterium]|nr:lipocalin family protein [Sphingobacteriales bacterium]
MKSTKLMVALVVLVTIFMIGCKGKSAKELIVKKWKISDISGNGAKDLTDSIKKILYTTATMEFTKEGKYITTDPQSGTNTGSYTLSADGKTLISNNEGSTVKDSLDIVELSATKFIVSNKKEDVKIVFEAK